MDAPGEDDGQLHAGWSHRLVFIFCGIGLNVCFAIYLSYIRVYGSLDNSMLGYMMISIYTAALAVVIFLGVVSKYAPPMMSPKAKYGFFISFSLVAMAATLALMPFYKNTLAAIIVFGVLIGLFEGSGLTLSQELASAYSGDTTKYVNTGHTIAQLFPVVLSPLFGMYKEETAARSSEIAFTLIPAGVCAVALMLYLGVLMTGGFDAAFDGMKLKQKTEKVDEDTPLLEANSDGGTGEAPKEDNSVRWFDDTLGTCVGVMILTHGMSAGFSPLTQAVGSLAFSHLLMLVRFVGEFLGRLCSHFWGVQFYNGGTTSLLVYTCVRVFLLLGLITQALLGNFSSEKTRWVFGAQVFLFFMTGSYVHSDTMALAVDSRPKHAQTVAYGMMLLCFGAQLVALAAVVPILQRTHTDVLDF